MSLTTSSRAAASATVPLNELPIDRGVAVLLEDQPVAIFRLSSPTDEVEVYAVSHIDPRTGAGVMARGLVGSVADRPVVASPLHKERYDLRTGECLDNQALSLQTYGARLEGHSILVHNKENSGTRTTP